MGKVITAAAVSLDGYIAGPNETGMEHLFAWFDAGPFEVTTTNPDVRILLSEPDHRWFTAFNDRIGVFVSGRRLFDLAGGWGGRHPMDKPAVIVTHSVPGEWVAAHPDAPFTFVTEGVAAAVETARAIAGDRDIAVSSGKVSSQCFELGLIDELSLDLVPVLLGDGVPLFEHLANAPILLDGPIELVEGHRVTHLRYTVRRT